MNSESSLIAVSQRVVEVAGRNEARDCLDQQWAIWLQSLGYSCVPMPNRLASVRGFLEEVRPRAIILSGGNNISASVYDGTDSDITISDAYACRDLTEHTLVEFAMQEGLPVLGCCRGMQFLHVFFGGRLSPLSGGLVNHVNREHPVVLLNETVRQFARVPEFTVNSFHDFGFQREALPQVLLPFAISPLDGVVEGFCHHSAPIVGVMWHPERKSPSADFDATLVKELFTTGDPLLLRRGQRSTSKPHP